MQFTDDLKYVNSKYSNFMRDAISHNFLSEKTINILEFTDAIVLPEYWGFWGIHIVDSFGNLLYGNKLSKKDVSRVRYLIKDVESYDKKTLYLGMIHQCYGHSLTTSLSYLWPLASDKFIKKIDTEDITLAFQPIMADCNLSSNGMESIFDLLNIDIKSLFKICKPTKFSRLLIPEPCLSGDVHYNPNICYYTKEYIQLINKISVSIPPYTNGGENIYLSRVGFTNSGNQNVHSELGEESIERKFFQKGFTVIRPEEYSLKDQIAIYKGCKTLVATDGYIAHNAIFLNEHANLVILRKSDYINGFQMIINHAKKLKVTFIDVHKSSINKFNTPSGKSSMGPFFLYVTKELCSFLDINYEGFPFIKYIEYLISPVIKFIARTFKDIRLSIKKVIKHILKFLRIYDFVKSLVKR